MSAASNFLEQRVLNHLLKATTYTPPATLYVGLFKGAAGDNLEANIKTDEVSGGAYTRLAISWGTGSFVGNGFSIASSADLIWPTATANWGTINFVAVLDSATVGGGNVLFYSALPTGKTINSGQIAKINQNSLVVSVS